LLGAELIFIDEYKEECMARAKNNEWKKFIEEWFDIYTPPSEGRLEVPGDCKITNFLV